MAERAAHQGVTRSDCALVGTGHAERALSSCGQRRLHPGRQDNWPPGTLRTRGQRLAPGSVFQYGRQVERRPLRASLHLAPGITSTWRQASPPPGAYQAGRYHPGRPGQDARKGRLYISCEAVTQKCRDAPCGRLPAVEVSGARHNPAAYQAGKYHLA